MDTVTVNSVYKENEGVHHARKVHEYANAYKLYVARPGGAVAV